MLIPQYRVKARAVLSNSWSEEILLLQSQPQSSETSATSGTGITEGSDTFFNNDIVEAWHPSTGLCSAVPLLNSASFKSVVWIATAPQLLLGWYPETSTVVGLHRDQQQEKAISFRLQLPLKSPQAIGVCCVSSLSDGICFLALKREPTIYVLHYSGEKVVSTKPIRVEKLLGHTEKPKGSIVSMYCHPSRQFLVVAYSKGSVQIYSYVQVHLLLRKSLAKAQTDVDFLSRQSGTESAEEGEHPESDEEVEGAEGNIVSKARRILSQAGLLQPIGMMVAPRDKRLLMFVQCGRRDNFNRETGIADLELTASDIQMDYHGSFAAVVWSSSLTCIYDTSVLPTQEQVTKAAKVIMRSGSSTVASRFPVIEVGLYGTFPAALCSSAALNSSSGIVEVALGPLAFHPSEALLLQTVLRKKSAKTRNSSGVLDSNDRIAVPPLVFGLSLVTSQPFLHFVGCSVLTEDVDLKDSDSTCLNYRPLRMHFTPNSCRLVLSVECIQLHQLSSGFIKKNALGVHEINSSFLGESAVDMKAEDEAEDGTETSIENAGVEKTSDVLQSVNVQYKKDSPFQVLVEEIVFSYSIDSIWSRKNGFLNVFPVYSKLQVPVDVFLHGEMVLSPSHQYNYDSAQPGINSNGKFPESGVSNTSIIKNVGANFGGAKLVDMKGQTSNTKHDISPIWIIKPKAYIVNGMRLQLLDNYLHCFC